MPRIPLYQAQTPLPASSGIARGGGGTVPVVPQPGVNDPGASALERSLGAMPQTLTHLGGVGMQMAELEQRRQQAQDTLDATLSDQEAAQRLDRRFAELQEEGDYRTLPQTFMEEGNRILQEVALERGLSSQARAVYQARGQERLTVMQQKALAFRSKRQDQDKSYALGVTVHDAMQRVANATDPYERQVALGQADETFQAFVASGLADGGAVADIRHKMLQGIEVQDVQTAIQANPEAMYTQLLAQTRGEPTREDLPRAPADSLAQLTAQARDVRRQQWSEREHQERWGDHQMKKQQEQNSIALRASVYTTPLTPANVPTFDRLIRQAADMMQRGELDASTGEHLMQAAQAHGAAAAKPPVRQDNEAVKDTLTLMVMQAQTPTEFARARDTLTQAGVKALTTDTFMMFAQKLEQREKGQFWHDQPEVRAAREILVRGAIIPYGGSFAGQMKPKMQQKLSLALDTWEYALQQRLDDPRQGLDAVRRDARALAEEMRQRYLKPDFEDKADVQEYLPHEVQGAKTSNELAQVLHKLHQEGVPPWQLMIMQENWHRWKGSAEELMNAPPNMPAPAGPPPQLGPMQRRPSTPPGVSGAPAPTPRPSTPAPALPLPEGRLPYRTN